LPFDTAAVTSLLRKYWLHDPQYDALMLHVLQYLKVWDEPAANMLSSIARRTAAWNIPYITDTISQQNPGLAPLVFRADLDRRLGEAQRKDAEQALQPPPPADANHEELAIHRMLNDPHKSVKELLEGDLGWHELSVIAESAPEAFLERVWLWFICVLEEIGDDPHPFIIGYRDDHSLGTKLDRDHGTESQPAAALRDAIVRLAEDDPPAFLDFFRRNETSNFLSAHRLFCHGLEKLACKYPKLILEYLIADPRRLTVGDFEDCHRESRALISCVAPFLDRTDLDRLEQAVLKWNKYWQSVESWTPEDRLKRLKWNREHRLRLLRAFPASCLSEQTRRFREQEERAFPDLRGWDSRSRGGMVVSRMSVDQMQKAKNSDIVGLFEELVDDTGWDHPRFQKFDRFVGGAVQASRELEPFAEREPGRAASLLAEFKPGQHEMAAGAVLRGLAKSDFPAAELFDLVIGLNSAGFSGDHFRNDVAQALKTVAEKNKGLPEIMLELMESWLPIYPEPTPDRIQSKERDRHSGSLLWGLSGAFSLPGGRDLIFDAVATGYLLREPQDVQGWAEVIQRALGYEHHPDVWRVIIGRMPLLYNADRALATELFDQVLTTFPHTRESASAVLAVASVIILVSDTQVIQKWLSFYREGEWPLGQQAFGEMLLWHLIHKPDDSWARDEVWNALKDPGLVGIHRGLAFAAAYNWHHPGCQQMCTSVLVALAGSNDQAVQQAVSVLFVRETPLLLNGDMKRIIEAILPNDMLLMKSAENLIESLEAATPTQPELVFKVCSRFLDVASEDIKNIATQYALLAEPLVSIALTLHRMPPPHREAGLLLFERLTESNIREARQALDALDRRPLRSQLSTLPTRHRRRHPKAGRKVG
jgi:hypothetical protein